jgi:hypothetical protein
MKELQITCKESKESKKIDSHIKSEGFTAIEILGLLEDLKLSIIIENRSK